MRWGVKNMVKTANGRRAQLLPIYRTSQAPFDLLDCDKFGVCERRMGEANVVRRGYGYGLFHG